MNLIIDIGNTRTKLGVFDKETLKHTTVLRKGWSLDRLKKTLKRYHIERVALSSVSSIEQATVDYLQENFVFLQLSDTTKLPISNHYKTPKTLGKDRLAAVVGAHSIYPGSNCLVVDAGTCITYDLITKKGDYLGGNIAPGITMRLEAMHQMTAKLPLVRRQKNNPSYGTTTVTAIRTGAQKGALMELEGFIRDYNKEFGRFKVLVTGGDAEYFANHIKTKIFVIQHLVLIGLNKILNYNAQHL